MIRPIALAIALLLITTASRATVLRPVTPRELIDRAEFVFEGRVIAVENRMSEKSEPGDALLPHTFVTFKVLRILHGKADGTDHFTLRIRGGRLPNGHFLRLEGCPFFQVGDHDVLFVDGNGSRMCPLVGWQQGRFRIVDGLVYSGSGEELRIDGAGRIIAGESSKNPALHQTRLPGGVRFETVQLPIEDASYAEKNPEGKQLQRDAFMKWVSELRANEERPPAANLDPSVPFRVKRPRAIAPPPSGEKP